MIERVDRQDDTVMQQLIDSAASRYPYLLYSIGYSSAPSDREPLDNGLGCSDHYRYSAKTTAIIDIETPSQEPTLGQRADSRARMADTTSLVSTRQDRPME